MSPTTKPGVLAEMDRAATCAELCVPNTTIAADLREARATVERLAEAAAELDEAQADYDRLDAPGGAKFDRLYFARENLRAALAAFRGEAP